MKIHAEREALLEASQAVARVVSQRSALPVLAGIRITAAGGGVAFDATDLELFLAVRTEFAVEEPGVAVVPGRLFGDIVRSLQPGRVTIEDRPAEGKVWIRGGQSEFVLAALPADDFPAVPDMPAGEAALVAGPELARALRQVVPAASGDEGRPVLTGVLWSLRDRVLRLVATDSYRLALRDLAVTAGAAGEAVVPGRALAEFARHLNGDEEASIWVGGTQGGFEVGRTRMVTRLIEGKFPDYRQLIPDAYPHRLVADRDQLAEALERMALVAKANTPVKVHLDAEVRLTATQAGVADASETVDGVAYDGDPMVVGFNPRHLIEGLRSLDDGKAVLELVDPNRPGRLRSDGHEEFTYVLMPVRLWT